MPKKQASALPTPPTQQASSSDRRRIQTRRSGVHGKGVFALQDLAEGETLIEYVGLVQRGDGTIEARKEILTEQRELLVARMKEMQKTLDILDHKIEVYENAVLTKEQAIIQVEE